MEKLYLAALDQGQMDIATVRETSPNRTYHGANGLRVCHQEALAAFASKFPDSPRVDVLQGIMIEVKETADIAVQYYNTLLENDSSNAVCTLSSCKNETSD